MITRPFTKDQVNILRELFVDDERNLLLLELGICLAFRSNDLLNLKISDVLTPEKTAKEYIQIIQKKTGIKTISIPISNSAKNAIERFLPSYKMERYIFIGQKSHYMKKPISTRQHQRIIKKWAEMLEVDDVSKYSTMSLRKTLVNEMYLKTKNINVCKEFLGHEAVNSTAHYIDIESVDIYDVLQHIEI